jgi:hypothetical protein
MGRVALRSLTVRWAPACALAFVALGASACSAIVDPENLLIRCEARSGAADPCAPLGLACVGGTCQPCEPAAELCDGRDNDCDGFIDEGHDADGDGFTWCGGGRSEYVDCAPDDPNIHPTTDPDGVGEDRCDGYDNDCDGEIDEAPECEAMRRCIFGRCPEGLTCDVARNRCVAPRTRGSLCGSDAECGAGFCVTTRALGLEDVLADSLCATACCSDADCAEGGVCVQPGSGARVCLPVEIAGRRNRQVGERCASSADCASGVCHGSRCVATCSRDADCDGQTCRLNAETSTLLEGASAFICGEPGGRAPAPALCSSFDPNACASALCHELRCAAPCGSSADCGEGLACGYVAVRGLLGEGRVAACIAESGVVEGVPGAVCCTSADCGPGQACKPVEHGTGWGMFCGPDSRGEPVP